MRSIPIALVDSLATGRTSLCFLVKIKRKDGQILAFTTLDAAITYTDGPDGPITYLPNNGVKPSEQVWSASLSVDTAEIVGAIRDTGVTEQEIRAGLFDFARFWIYRVNYLDLTEGHYLWASGTTGETKFSENAWQLELRSKQQQLKQPIAETYTLTCPVPYGSPACGKEFEWFDITVDEVDPLEPDRIFSVLGDSDYPADERFRYGVMRFLTGDNAGIELEVEHHDGSDFALLLPLPYPAQPGDEAQVRIDCLKEARDEVYGCKSPLRWGADWIYHHRGFPDIPVADAASLQFPGAQAPSVPGRGTVAMTEAE